jgi:hypothetical protein
MDVIKMELDSDSGTSTSHTKQAPKVIKAECVDGQISESGMMQPHSKVIIQDPHEFTLN